MNLTITPNQYSQTVFTGRGNRARKIARKIEQRLPYIKEQQAKREGWNLKVNNSSAVTTAAAVTTGAASAVITTNKEQAAQNNTFQQKTTAEIPTTQYKETTPLKSEIVPESSEKMLKPVQRRKLPKKYESANEHLKHTSDFNILKAFDYMRTGLFSGIEEYQESGDVLIHGIDNSNGPRLTPSVFRIEYGSPAFNTLKYQEKLAKKILSSDAIVNNKSIRDRLFIIVTDDYNLKIPVQQSAKDKLTAQLEEMTDARIKLLDIYSKDKVMQENKEIQNEIGYLVSSIRTMEDYDFIIEVLKDSEEKYKATKENSTDWYPFYAKLGAFIHYRNIPKYITRTILRNPILEKMLGYVSVSAIIKNNESNAEKLKQVLDIMAQNSDTVKKMHESNEINHMTLIEAFEARNKNPIESISEKINAYQRRHRSI